jgi:hypothetical protein
MVKPKLMVPIISVIVLTGIIVFSLLPVLLPQRSHRESQKLSFQRILKIREETDYWIAYESPSEHGLSLAWGDGYLWMADIYDGTIYKAKETEEGLGIVKSWDLRTQPSDVFQMRDITWDGQTLWSVDWGTIQKHDPETMEVIFQYSENDQDPPWENMHHMWNIAWDGKHIWSGPEQLNRHSTEDYHVEAVYPSGVFPMNMEFKNENELWISDSGSGFIYQLDMSQLPQQGYPSLGKENCDCFDLQAELPEEAIPKIINVYSIVEKPYGIAWSDKNLWVYDLATKLIYKMKKLPDFPLNPNNEYLKEESYTVPGDIIGNVTWTLDKSPYVADGIDIPPGSTLTIEPGVKVFVRGEIIVQGTLRAIGTSERPIVFGHVEWNQSLFGFSFGDPNNVDVYSEGEGASASVLKYVIIEGGVGARNSLPTIQYSVLSGLYIRLEEGNHSSFNFVGNKLNGGGIKIEIGPKARISNIIIKGNVFENLGDVPTYIEYRGENPPKVLIEHNIMDHIFGAATIFDGSFEVTYRHNYLNDFVAYRGIMPPFNATADFSYNFIRHTFQAGVQLDDPSFRNVTVRYNTIIDSIVDSDWGNPSVKVEYNNILFSPEVEVWAGGLDASENKTARMSNNWWGTLDLEEVRKHIADSRTAEELGPLIIEPILTKPNGIGFLLGLIKDKATGKPISEAKITIGNVTLSSAVDGKFFSALPEGLHILTISAAGYQPKNPEVEITSTEVSFLELELTPKNYG